MCKTAPVLLPAAKEPLFFVRLRPFGVVENLFKKCGWRSPVGCRMHHLDAQVFIRIRSYYSFVVAKCWIGGSLQSRSLNNAIRQSAVATGWQRPLSLGWSVEYGMLIMNTLCQKVLIVI